MMFEGPQFRRAEIVIDTQKGHIWIRTDTNNVTQHTIGLFCEGIISVLGILRRAGDAPEMTQRRLNNIKHHIWNGIIDTYDKPRDVKIMMDELNGRTPPSPADKGPIDPPPLPANFDSTFSPHL